MPDLPIPRRLPIRGCSRGVPAVVVLTASLLGAPLVACSGAGGGGGPSATGREVPATAGGLEADVTDFSEALLRGDHAASYAALSASCRGQWPPQEWAARTDAVRQAVQSADERGEPVRVRRVRTRSVADDRAEATVELVTAGGEPTGPDPETSWARWVHEDGRWRLDDCPRFTTGTAVLSLSDPAEG